LSDTCWINESGVVGSMFVHNVLEIDTYCFSCFRYYLIALIVMYECILAQNSWTFDETRGEHGGKGEPYAVIMVDNFVLSANDFAPRILPYSMNIKTKNFCVIWDDVIHV